MTLEFIAVCLLFILGIPFCIYVLYKVFLFKYIDKKVKATIIKAEKWVICPSDHPSILTRQYYFRRLGVKLFYSYEWADEKYEGQSMLVTKIKKFEEMYKELGEGDEITIFVSPFLNNISEVELNVPRLDRRKLFNWGLLIFMLIIFVAVNIDLVK